MNQRASLAIAALLTVLSASAFALPGFPDYVNLPKDVIPYDAGSITTETMAEVEFPIAEGKVVTQRGRHVRSYTKWPDADNKPAAATWAQWLPALKATGWVLQGSDGSTTYSLKRVANGREAWLRVGLADYNQPLLQLIEVSAGASALTLTPPAAQPEKFGERDDFPYLGKPAGAQLSGTGLQNDPLDVTVSGVDGEAQLVGTGYLRKSYTPPASLSKLEFELSYRAALEKAGWQVKPLPAGAKPGEGQLVAHYTGNGRNIWAVLSRGNDNSNIGLTFNVADIGIDDWGSKLDKQCRVPLYGVNFDFDKASLRPDATPLLEKARDALKARASVAVAVQGHTDNVGTDDHNQKLSAARAETVRQWLAANGIAANRLSSRGFGKTAPVADNGTDAGRARNRRVELVREGCK